MVNRPKNIGTATEPSSTSPKPATPADPNDLRTALTKLAAKWRRLAGDNLVPTALEAPRACGEAQLEAALELEDLLAAHPAPETDEGDSGHVLFNRVPFPPECSCGTRMPDGNVQNNFNQHLVDVAAPAQVSARVLERAADDMEAVIALGDAAESTAVPAGTKGVGSAIGARDALYEDPVTWLRERAARLRGATRG